MDNLQTLGLAFATIGGALGSLALAVFAQSKPLLDTLTPLALAYFAHRYIRNQTAADVLTQAGSAAYLNLGNQFASGKPNFVSARQAAIAGAVAGLNEAAQAALKHLTPQQVAAGVSGSLGQLLAADPAFRVTDPYGNAAATVVNNFPPLPTVQIPAWQSSIVTAGGPPNGVGPGVLSNTGSGQAGFDVAQLATAAVR